jgi:hypothetical protein
MTEEEFERYEEYLLGRYPTMDEETRKSDAGWFMWYTQQSCELIEQKLEDPSFSAQHEILRKMLSSLQRRQEKLAMYVDDEVYTKICNLVIEAKKSLKEKE